MRDPKSALVAEWHRERTKRQTNATTSSHFLVAGEEYFSEWENNNSIGVLCMYGPRQSVKVFKK